MAELDLDTIELPRQLEISLAPGACSLEPLSQFVAALQASDADPALASSARAEAVLQWAAKAVGAGDLRSDMIPGWDPDLRALLDALAERAPELLKRQRDQFSSAAAQQVDFALALCGEGPWPLSVMPAVARDYLNSPPGRFAYEGRIDIQVLRSSAMELLRSEPVPLLQWSRVEPLLNGADEEFRKLLLLNYCGQDFRSRAFELAEATTESFAELLLSALSAPSLSFSGAISASLVLTQRRGNVWGKELPRLVRQALLWDLRCGNDVEANVSLRAYAHLDPRVAGELLRQCIGEARAIALVPALKDEQVIRELLDHIGRSGESSPVIVEALIACGSAAAEALVEACGKKGVATEVGVVAAEVLGRIAQPEVSTLIALLGHSSKRVVGAAAKSLERLDESAREALSAGGRAPKKAIRQHCERLLAKLGEKAADEETQLSAVRERAKLYPRAAREAFIALCSAAGESESSWQDQLKPELKRLGATALELLREWFIAGLQDGETRLWCYAVEELRGDPEAVWVAVDTFARMPKLGTSLWARPRRALSHCGDLLSAPIVHALHSVHTEYREALFGLLAAHAVNVEPSVFLTGLRDPSKTVRAHSVDGLSRSADGPLYEVAELLGATELGTRVAAAELLAVWGRAEVAPQAVQAWANERSKHVRAYLEDTLVACGRADMVFDLQPGAKLDEGAVERYLLAQKLPDKLPNFIQLQELPPLRFSSGASVPRAVQHGFLARLMKLELTLKGRAVRRLLPLFNSYDVHAWSRWVYQGWSQLRSPKHKWAVLQLSLLADDALLNEAMSQLGEWRGQEHAAVSGHLRAAQWHGSDVSVQWLGYWSENLASLGGRSTARQLLSRVAFKRRRSLSELRRELNPFIGEEHQEALLSRELAPGYVRQQLLANLERSFLTGREWGAQALFRLLSTQRYLRGECLLWRSREGEICRLIFGDDGEAEFRDLAGNNATNSEWLRLLHPLELTQKEQLRCRSLGLQTPAFPQLDRERYHYSQLDELVGLCAPNEDFSKWRRASRWFHGEAMDGGIVYADTQHLLSRNLVITMHHSGYGIGVADFQDDVRLLRFDFADLEGNEVAPGDLPETVYSEFHRGVLGLERSV